MDDRPPYDSASRLHIQDLYAVARKLRPPPRETIFLHPHAAIELGSSMIPPQDIHSICGLPIYTSPWLPKHPKKWQFPKDRFVEYGPEDEAWARPVGFGREVDDTTQMIGYRIQMPKL